MWRETQARSLDVFHATHHDVTPLLCSTPMVVTVLDLTWLDVPEGSSRAFRSYYWILTKGALGKARRIVTISESTRDRVIHHFPGSAPRVTAIPIACDPEYGRPSEGGGLDWVATRFGLKGPYVLYAGSFAARKNLPLLLRAWDRVSMEMPDLQLVLAGRPSGRNDTSLEEARRVGSVVLDRRKSVEEMKALYAGAAMLVFPSRYEGFGLPVLEAMSSGCPVIGARTTSIPEIVGDAGILVDPDDPDELAVRILELMRAPERRRGMKDAGLLRAKQFDWRLVARKTLEAYQDATR
jgi:alpha-1,3-rhamnosyl/mannosyltransferase